MLKHKVLGHIRTYSRETRDEIIIVAHEFLETIGISVELIDEMTNNLLSCVDEIIKNAVKANYKYLLIVEEMQKRFEKEYPEKNEKEIKELIRNIVKDQGTFDKIADTIVKNCNISKHVREILNEEAKFLSIKNKVYLEKRDFSVAEIEKIKQLKEINRIRSRLKENDVKIVLKIQSDEDFIYVEVMNTAPILTKDLERIYNKRDEYQKYKEKHIEHEFFINNLDTSESGFGLGYATIDSFLSDWGLDSIRSLTIISSIDTTVLMTLPIEQISSNIM